MESTAFYQECLKSELARRSEKNTRYSLRAFARYLGFEATVISQILAGKRIPTPKSAQKLMTALNLSPEEQRKFLTSLAEKAQSRSLKLYNSMNHLQIAPPDTEDQAMQELSINLFRVISEWYHLAILELTFVKDFNSDPSWIAKELGISPIEAKLAIDRMISIGLFAKKDNKLVKTKERIMTADRHLTTPALRKYQKQILEKAIYSLENDPIEIRSMSGITTAIRPENIPQAKKLIEEYSQKITKFLRSGGPGTQVYQLSVALFPLQTKKTNKKKTKEKSK